MKTCEICKITKSLTEFSTCGSYKDKIYYRGECKLCNRIIFKESGAIACKKYKTSEKGKATRKARRQTEENKAKQREYDRNRPYTLERKLSRYNYTKNRLKTEPFYRLRLNVRNRLRDMMKAKKWHKDNNFSQYIGCSLEELKKYIENQFSPEMNWENYAKIWQVDHVKALGLAKTEQEMYSLCHFSNLKPMLIEDHKAKTILDVIEIKKSKIT